MADYISNWEKKAFILLCGTSFILVNFKIIKKHSVFINLHTMNLFNSFSGTKYSVVYHFNLLLQRSDQKDYLFIYKWNLFKHFKDDKHWMSQNLKCASTYFKSIGLKK